MMCQFKGYGGHLIWGVSGGNEPHHMVKMGFLLRNQKLVEACYGLVAIELKTGAFKPEYAGKMNFYLNLLDDTVRESDENPSIGIILCADRDHFEVEYAIASIISQKGVQ